MPGAVIECAADGVNATVADFDQWLISGSLFIVGKDRLGGSLCAFTNHGNRWAKVITPTPVQRPDTLQPGDACECSEAMQTAIIEMGKSMGIFEDGPLFTKPKGIKFTLNQTLYCYGIAHNGKTIDEWEFIRRLKNMAPLKMLGDHVYTLEDGHVIADGNKIPFDHVHKLNAEILNLK